MSRKSRPRSVPMRVLDLAAEREALDLKLNGHSYRAIADLQGCGVSTAHDRVERALASLVPVETIEAVRKQEQERYEAVQSQVLRALGAAVQPREDAEGRPIPPDPDAVAKLSAAFVRVADRKAKLLGLDAPAQHRVEVTGALEAEVQALADELAAAARGEALPTS